MDLKILRPSSSSIWLKCPASYFLSKDSEELFGEEESSVFADAGTYYHQCMENLVKGLPFERNKFCLTLTKEKEIQTNALSSYETFIVPMLQGAEFVTCEERINKGFDNGWGISGQIDLKFIKNGVMNILDYKYGKGIIEATSPQLSCYALLASQGLPVKVWVLQPRVKKPMTSREISVEENLVFESTLRDYINSDLNVETPQCRPELSVCKYCKGGKLCQYKI
jgi:hypothetical protein